jgi:hypothetical protein
MESDTRQKLKVIEADGSKLKLQVVCILFVVYSNVFENVSFRQIFFSFAHDCQWDTAGQEKFRTMYAFLLLTYMFFGSCVYACACVRAGSNQCLGTIAFFLFFVMRPPVSSEPGLQHGVILSWRSRRHHRLRCDQQGDV